ncbi:hypothetical protein J8I87_29560 [Paraburkholderia sp. LEh10]|jgi:hypothetical protein|uniref:hypothetical protein n=1 Tax=Paraburkholderia sp. LEh10 TaxID=2821353 RepID=UPI001AE31C50|nr:hypothetical protein [Paraburkholderia sp. LEh10]MBP0593761.1 hypothetical protein [Paraburkholderia sp. LEh10]
MPISGPVHAINFQSINASLFERPENFFASPCLRGFSGSFDRWARTGFAQSHSVFCVHVVRNTPRACIHPINAIKFLTEWNLILS